MADHACSADCPCEDRNFAVSEYQVQCMIEHRIGTELPPIRVVADLQDLEPEGYDSREDPPWGQVWLDTDAATGTDIRAFEIHMRNDLTASQAVRVLLHETKHVEQYLLGPEGSLIEVQERHLDEQFVHGYWDAPYELEAVDAERHWPEYGWLLEEAAEPPERCPTCGSDDPRYCRKKGAGVHGHGDSIMLDPCCPDPFHSDTEERCPTCGSPQVGANKARAVLDIDPCPDPFHSPDSDA